MCDRIIDFNYYATWKEAFKITTNRSMCDLYGAWNEKEYTGPYSKTPVCYRKVMNATYQPSGKNPLNRKYVGFCVFQSIVDARLYAKSWGIKVKIRRVEIKGNITVGTIKTLNNKGNFVLTNMLMAKKMRMFGEVKNV